MSVVLPCYNEMAVIEESLSRLSVYLEGVAPHYEIVVVDDGSDDGTPDLPWLDFMENYRAVYLRSARNEGKGGAVRRGLRAAAGPLVFFTDIDLPVELESLGRCLDRLAQGDVSIVLGNRRLKDSRKVGASFRCRRIVSRLFNWGVRVLAVRGCADTQCCLKGFTSDALAQILPLTELNSFAFDVELIYVARRIGLAEVQCPVQWRDARGHPPHLTLIKILVTNLLDVARLRKRSYAYRSHLEQDS
ncbi:glycosyltransferase [Streptomyces phaeofaciens]|uniref:glycosyltransferase n=1 Tax=Streptomyces phaeofaciens TaxID=68254 RepID=UPI001671C257|nr:glycosyltransferase [Streptomyces phaeofaciens]